MQAIFNWALNKTYNFHIRYNDESFQYRRQGSGNYTANSIGWIPRAFRAVQALPPPGGDSESSSSSSSSGTSSTSPLEQFRPFLLVEIPNRGAAAAVQAQAAPLSRPTLNNEHIFGILLLSCSCYCHFSRCHKHAHFGMSQLKLPIIDKHIITVMYLSKNLTLLLWTAM